LIQSVIRTVMMCYSVGHSSGKRLALLMHSENTSSPCADFPYRILCVLGVLHRTMEYALIGCGLRRGGSRVEHSNLCGLPVRCCFRVTASRLRMGNIQMYLFMGCSRVIEHFRCTYQGSLILLLCHSSAQ